jgi:hypothetical protein
MDIKNRFVGDTLWAAAHKALRFFMNQPELVFASVERYHCYVRINTSLHDPRFKDLFADELLEFISQYYNIKEKISQVVLKADRNSPISR